MAEYVCESCGMGVVGMKCAKCEKTWRMTTLAKKMAPKWPLPNVPTATERSNLLCAVEMTRPVVFDFSIESSYSRSRIFRF